MDFELNGLNVDPPDTSSGLVLGYEFSVIRPQEVDKLVGDVRHPPPQHTSMFDPCPIWLVKEVRRALQPWFTPIINASLSPGEASSYC